MLTVMLSPGVTVQFASPVQAVSWVSLAGSSSYHAYYWSPRSGLLGADKDRAHRGSGVLIPKSKGERLPLHGGTADSLNWSGYAVTPTSGGVTAVSSTFTVPSAGLAPPGFAATWTGIGGYDTSDLIQAGTAVGMLKTPAQAVASPAERLLS